MASAQFFSFCRTACIQDDITRKLQEIRCSRSESWFILNDQESFSLRSWWFCGFFRDDVSSRIDSRKVDLKRGALSHFAVNPNKSPTLFDDAVHHSQTTACSLASFFRRKKWLEMWD